MWSLWVQIFHALTRQRKTTTAAAEWRNPQPARVRRRRGRGSEALPHRRRWSSSDARVWEARVGVRASGVKVKWGRGRGIYSGGEKLYTRGFQTNVPLTLLIHVTYVNHVLRGGDRGWEDKYIMECVTVWAAKAENSDKNILKFRSQFLQLTRT